MRQATKWLLNAKALLQSTTENYTSSCATFNSVCHRKLSKSNYWTT